MGNERAKEYILHGVSRRLGLLQRCIDKIFMLFPANRMEKLTQSDRQDLEINLHAFLINIYGIIENIGLALAYENDLIENKSAQKLHIKEINLFNKRFQNLLNPKLKEYLTEDTIGKWYIEYAKNYRDALAHRIPPYVPPAALNDEEQRRFKDLDKELQSLTYEKDLERIEAIQDEQDSLGSSNPLFVHSFFEKAKPVYLHPQLIADYRTVEEILMKALDNFNCVQDDE
jgi:hypothetical protein